MAANRSNTAARNPHEVDMAQHVDATISSLAEQWFFGPTLGPKYGQILQKRFNSRSDQRAVDDALALGGYLIHSDENKHQRHAVRAVLLANFLMKEQPLTLKDQLLTQCRALPTMQLKKRFTHLFPAFLDNNVRPAWNPVRFTNPMRLVALHRPTDWSRRAVPPYMLFVHTLKHPSAVLDAPVATLSQWTAISMSVLCNINPVAYSNHGVILEVPQENILSTSPTDQWFDNYAGTPQSIKAKGQSMAAHIAEKNILLGGLLTPDEVAAHQGTDRAMDYSAGTARTAHNEVVVCGVPGQPLPHGSTGQLRLAGVFIQTRMDGTMPEIYPKSNGTARQIELAVSACARNYHVPLLYLPTTQRL
jgi:hypothetical protein